MSLPSEEKRYFVAVMQHTLHAVRTADRKIEFCGECALTEKDRVQNLVQTWSEGRAVSGIVAIAPEPVWWHLGESAEMRTLHTDADVRRFAERLPHNLRRPLEMMACNAADGRGVSPDGDERWLLGVTQGDALAAAAAGAVERGIVTAALGSAILDSVAAAATAVQLEGAGVVRLWAIGQDESHVFTVTVHGIEAIDRCATGFNAIFAAAQQVFGVQTVAEAKDLFFEQRADAAAAAHLASVIAPALQSVLGTKTGDAPMSFACTGLTSKEAWFARAIAQAVGLPYWQSDLNRYLDRLQLKLGAHAGDVPSLSLLGTMHRAAIHTRRSPAWHLSWGLILRGAARRKIHQPINFAVAPPSSARPAAVSVAAPAGRSEVPSQSSFLVVPPSPTKPSVPPRELAPPVSVPVARQEANDESKAGAPAAVPPTAAPSTSASSPEPQSSSARFTPDVRSAVPVVSDPKPAANDRTDQHPPAPASPGPVSPPNPPVPAPPRPPVAPVTARAVTPVTIRDEASRTNRRPTSEWNGNRKPPPAPWSPEEKASSASEPDVIILRRTGYWPVVGIVLALLGAGLGWKFHLDAEAVKAAAQMQRRAAEQVQEMAEREIAAAVEQVRRASEQAAKADQRARELAVAKAGNTLVPQRARVETVPANSDATDQARREAIEQARREAIEQGRREAIEQARREAIEQARREAEAQTVRIVARELAAARAAAAPGNLKIESVPAGADVHVDNRPAQRAPASIEGIPPGRHAVRLALAGYVPRELTVDIVPSKTTDLGPIKLERALGGVAVSSSPAGLEFSIRPSSTVADAAPVRRGRTPAQLNDLPTGEYVVQFSRTGWPERTERVTIERGTTARVATAFQGGTVRINSSPTGATVLQGGQLLGKTPLTLDGLPPQEVTYELSAHGYEPLKVSGTVAEGRELELDGILLDLNRVVNADGVRTLPRPSHTTPLLRGRIPRSVPPVITVSLIVLPNGSPEDVRVLGDVDSKLARICAEAIAKWKFSPGVSHAGYPVKVRMTMPIRLTEG